MTVTYPACFFKEEGGYSVVFPDLNFLATQGKNLDEAFRMAVDVLAAYLYRPAASQVINPPSPLERVSLKETAKAFKSDVNPGSFVNYVSVDVEKYARENFNCSVKKTLSIPMWLNDIAVEKNVNFSKVLKEALIEKLNIQ